MKNMTLDEMWLSETRNSNPGDLVLIIPSNGDYQYKAVYTDDHYNMIRLMQDSRITGYGRLVEKSSPGVWVVAWRECSQDNPKHIEEYLRQDDL